MTSDRVFRIKTSLWALLGVCMVAQACAALKIGDQAPDFSIPGTAAGISNETKKLSDLQGRKNVLIAFYPKAFTRGCTKQLCGYTDDYDQFRTNHTVVIAVSMDKQADSNAFKEKYRMPFLVVGDEHAGIIQAYGVPIVRRNNMPFAQRAVFLVDKTGTIRYIDLHYNIHKGRQALYKMIQRTEKSG